MPKIQVGKTKTVLLLYLLRVTAATVCCFGACCAVGALVVYKLDLDFKLIVYICAAIDFLCAFLIAKWALRGVKNSRLPLALAAIVPAMVLTVAHYCMAPSGAVYWFCACWVCRCALRWQPLAISGCTYERASGEAGPGGGVFG